jgi:Tfp pilus assembly protein PilF
MGIDGKPRWGSTASRLAPGGDSGAFDHPERRGADRMTDLDAAIAHLQSGDWQAAHVIVQADEDSPLACWAHGIVHLMEGDIDNARYWYRRARRTFPNRPDAAAEIAGLRAAIEEQGP